MTFPSAPAVTARTAVRRKADGEHAGGGLGTGRGSYVPGREVDEDDDGRAGEAGEADDVPAGWIDRRVAASRTATRTARRRRSVRGSHVRPAGW